MKTLTVSIFVAALSLGLSATQVARAWNHPPSPTRHIPEAADTHVIQHVHPEKASRAPDEQGPSKINRPQPTVERDQSQDAPFENSQ